MGGGGIVRESLVRSLPYMMMFFFAVYPTVSSTVFKAFDCTPFDGAPTGRWEEREVLPDGVREWYLAADTSMKCFSEFTDGSESFSTSKPRIHDKASSLVYMDVLSESLRS